MSHILFSQALHHIYVVRRLNFTNPVILRQSTIDFNNSLKFRTCKKITINMNSVYLKTTDVLHHWETRMSFWNHYMRDFRGPIISLTFRVNTCFSRSCRACCSWIFPGKFWLAKRKRDVAVANHMLQLKVIFMERDAYQVYILRAFHSFVLDLIFPTYLYLSLHCNAK